MTVMTGQVSAPAVIALATSTPRRMPSLSVFHFDVDEAEAEVVGVVDDFFFLSSWVRFGIVE